MTSPIASSSQADPLVLNRESVAALLDVPLSTIDNLHRIGELQAFRIGKHNRWHVDDVRAFIERARKDRDGANA